MRPVPTLCRSADANRAGIAWPIPWCDRAAVKYATYARRTHARQVVLA